MVQGSGLNARKPPNRFDRSWKSSTRVSEQMFYYGYLLLASRPSLHHRCGGVVRNHRTCKRSPALRNAALSSSLVFFWTPLSPRWKVLLTDFRDILGSLTQDKDDPETPIPRPSTKLSSPRGLRCKHHYGSNSFPVRPPSTRTTQGNMQTL